jgi:hypothetical protein
MNSVNTSTGLSGFQLHLSHPAQIIAPIIPSKQSPKLCKTLEVKEAMVLLEGMEMDVCEARDNLWHAKVLCKPGLGLPQSH